MSGGGAAVAGGAPATALRRQSPPRLTTGDLRQERFEAVEVLVPRELFGAGAGGARERVVVGAEGGREGAREGVDILGVVDDQGGERAVQQLGGAGAPGGHDRH